MGEKKRENGDSDLKHCVCVCVCVCVHVSANVCVNSDQVWSINTS